MAGDAESVRIASSASLNGRDVTKAMHAWLAAQVGAAKVAA